MTFKVYTDPGHGWIAVKRKLLHELNIADKITPYSYQKGDTVYLEEDLDASTFIAVYTQTYGERPSLVEKYTHKQSPVRYYESYRFY